MFVTRKKYDALRADLEHESKHCVQLLLKLHSEIANNVRLRRQLMVRVQPAPTTQLTDSDIQRLLSLCHPDKHGGKASATEMTQKLLAMRGK